MYVAFDTIIVSFFWFYSKPAFFYQCLSLFCTLSLFNCSHRAMFSFPFLFLVYFSFVATEIARAGGVWRDLWCIITSIFIMVIFWYARQANHLQQSQTITIYPLQTLSLSLPLCLPLCPTSTQLQTQDLIIWLLPVALPLPLP